MSEEERFDAKLGVFIVKICTSMKMLLINPSKAQIASTVKILQCRL
jgi:hypothetical protein